MANILLVILCLGLGAVARRRGWLPATTPSVLNACVICIAYPALALQYVPRLILSAQFGWDLFIATAMPWLIFTASFLIFYFGFRERYSRMTRGALLLTVGLGNTSFVGFPLLRAFLGESSMPMAIWLDQSGTFLIVSTFGIFAAGLCSDRRLTLAEISVRVFRFPPFLALLVGLICGIAGLYLPPENFVVRFVSQDVAKILSALSALLVPLALISVGFQLQFSRETLRARRGELALGLSLKLFITPVAVFAALWVFGHATCGVPAQTLVLEGAMAPMITAAIVAGEFGLDGELANLMVGLGIPLSLVTVALWHLLMNSLCG